MTLWGFFTLSQAPAVGSSKQKIYLVSLGYLDAHLLLGVEAGQIRKGRNNADAYRKLVSQVEEGSKVRKAELAEETDLGTKNHPHKPKNVHVTLLYYLKCLSSIRN